jgi:hypothetical protein
MDVVLFSETFLKPHEIIPNNHFYRTVRFPEMKGGSAVAVRKGIPHNHLDLHTFVSIEGTGVCIRIGSSEALLAVVKKLRGHAYTRPPVHIS